MKQIPLHCIVVLIGSARAGKTTWAQQTFPLHEIIGADDIRLELTGDSDNTSLNLQVWNEIARRAELKISQGQRAVIDSTNLKIRDRRVFVDLAERYGVDLVYVPINRSLESKLEGCPPQAQAMVDKNHHLYLSLEREILSGDQRATVIEPSLQAVPHPSREWQPSRLLVVGDVHGNFDAMAQAVELAQREGLHIVWLGDVVDYGPSNLRCLKLAYDTVRTGQAAMIWGNHERKIDRWITSDWGGTYRGRLSDANQMTINEITSLNPVRRDRFEAAWLALRSWSWQHVVIGSWMFSHGAALPEMWTRTDRRLPGEAGNRAFFGEVDNRIPTKADGYPNRIWDWVNQVPEAHTVVVGHDWLDRVTNSITVKPGDLGGQVLVVDCGSSKGGRLGAIEVNTQENSYTVHYFDG